MRVLGPPMEGRSLRAQDVTESLGLLHFLLHRGPAPVGPR